MEWVDRFVYAQFIQEDEEVVGMFHLHVELIDWCAHLWRFVQYSGCSW
jgi:hypothetical protein